MLCALMRKPIDNQTTTQEQAITHKRITWFGNLAYIHGKETRLSFRFTLYAIQSSYPMGNPITCIYNVILLIPQETLSWSIRKSRYNYLNTHDYEPTWSGPIKPNNLPLQTIGKMSLNPLTRSSVLPTLNTAPAFP